MLFLITLIYLSMEFKANSRKVIIITIKYNNKIIKLFISALRKLKNLSYILLFINLFFFLIMTSWSPLSVPAFLSNKDNCLRTVWFKPAFSYQTSIAYYCHRLNPQFRLAVTDQLSNEIAAFVDERFASRKVNFLHSLKKEQCMFTKSQLKTRKNKGTEK